MAEAGDTIQVWDVAEAITFLRDGAVPAKVNWGSLPDATVEKNAENKRKRYLKEHELPALTKALAAHPDKQAANIIWLLLLTGARRGEVLAMGHSSPSTTQRYAHLFDDPQRAAVEKVGAIIDNAGKRALEPTPLKRRPSQQ